jgi:alkane 1-monooxygenase
MTMTTLPISELTRPSRALPFFMAYLLVPLAVLSALEGGWTVVLVPIIAWYGFAALDAVLGRDQTNADPAATERDLAIYRLVTLLWAPVQFLLLFWLLWYVPQAEHLNLLERLLVFFGVGVVTGTVGINFSHELMHRKSALERWLADVLLAMVLYSHFRSEHLLVHHRYIGTPRDAVTARYNEGFHRFFPRVLTESFSSACRAEAGKLRRAGKTWWDETNPFWRYAFLQLVMILLAFAVGGWAAFGLFLLQAGVAIWQLELVNYVEHYGLTRKHLGDGKYEPVRPHHSWNAEHRASNWLLINLQRHSDHHYKPDRRFPVLQTYSEAEAPTLPYGYPVMTVAAMAPPLWRRLMNPRVRRWRQMFYPEIDDWAHYNVATNPMPR